MKHELGSRERVVEETMHLVSRMKLSLKLDPKKCPHRWSVAYDPTTAERVVYCDLCAWEYSREAIDLPAPVACQPSK